jgi:sn-glycerol 3-phosphate transport system ATP-binding protein
MGRAMIREPRIFLFDEPLSNLDAKLRVQMRLEIRRLHQRLGTTSIFVTHDQVEAMTLADRLVVMNHGRIEQIDTPAELYRRPANLFVAGFIGNAPMNMFAGRIDKGAVILDDGARFDGLAHAASGRDGDPVQVGIRPEDLEWQPQEGPGTLPFRVELVEELGSSKLVYGTIGGQPATVATTGSAPAVGAHLPVGPKAGGVHLFDARSGARLSAG